VANFCRTGTLSFVGVTQATSCGGCLGHDAYGVGWA